MAKGKEPSESLTGIITQTAEQITERAQDAMGNYLTWLQNAMSASPWGNTELGKKFLGYATENTTNALGFVQKLSQAKNLEDVVKIQTEFMTAQFSSFNEQAKNLGEIYARTATALRTPFGPST